MADHAPEMPRRPRRNPFRTFDLPTLAVSKIFNNLDYTALVHMSCSSKKISPAMRSLINAHISQQTRINVDIDSTFQTVSVVGPRRSFTLQIFNPRHREAANMRNGVTYNIEGVDMLVYLREGMMNMVKKDFEKDLVEWVFHLQALFNCKLGTITLSAKWDTDFDVLLKNPLFFCPDELVISSFAVHSDEMEFIFENYRTPRFDCCGSTRKDFKYEKPIIFPSVSFHYGSFLTLKNLKQMSDDCSKIRVEKCKLNGEELNEWLKHWLGSTKTKVQSLSITIPFSPPNEPVATSVAILADIPTLSLPTMRPFVDMEEFVMINASPSWDLKRDDGVWATVFIQQTNRVTRFEFHLWTTTVMTTQPNLGFE